MLERAEQKAELLRKQKRLVALLKEHQRLVALEFQLMESERMDVRSPRQREAQKDERARMQSGKVEVHRGLGQRDYAYACERGGLGMRFTRSSEYGDDGARGQAGMVVITEVSCDGPADRAGGKITGCGKLQCLSRRSLLWLLPLLRYAI
jgi:hypothetical protein